MGGRVALWDELFGKAFLQVRCPEHPVQQLMQLIAHSRLMLKQAPGAHPLTQHTAQDNTASLRGMPAQRHTCGEKASEIHL